MDEATREFFYKQQQLDKENRICIDCGTVSPQWASVSHGCYVSLESSGVHRSLGVHISFVRSTTMDSWKPIQLKMMELGGNRKLKDFFRQHSIPDDMPITQKYNTRAADWYRRNLRALAEGSELPAPLEDGTGHLPTSEALSTTQVAFANSTLASSGAFSSAGGASASLAHHYVGSAAQVPVGDSATHTVGGSSSSSAPGSPPQNRKPMDGFGSETLGRGAKMEGFGSETMGRGVRMDAFGNEAFEGGRDDKRDDFLSSLVGDDVSRKVSGKLNASWRAVGSFAGMAKTFTEKKVQQAKDERWLDVALTATKQGVGTAVETTQWAATKGVEAGRATYSYVQEGGGKALGSTAKGATQFVGNIVDGFSETLTEARGGGSSPETGTIQDASCIEPGMMTINQQPCQAFSDVDVSIFTRSDAAPQEKAQGDNPAADLTQSPEPLKPVLPAINPFADDLLDLGPPQQGSSEVDEPVAAPATTEQTQVLQEALISAQIPEELGPPTEGQRTVTSKPEVKAWTDDSWGDWS
mmetsp:Transcript_27938/g.64472  ORF Transcript_27938/g.64472 Transcript_27938/m.64472 type:complete len:525 (-) Transcript_27938:8-1582(-)